MPKGTLLFRRVSNNKNAVRHNTIQKSAGHFLPTMAVALCGIVWGGFWYPLRWFDELGVGGGWISFIFFAVAAASPLPWLFRQKAWEGDSTGQFLTGLLLGTAFSLYTVSLVMTDVIHAILLFYLTPVWSTLAGLAFFGERLTLSRSVSMLLGFGGMLSILGAGSGLPMPRNAGDWTALLSGIFWAAGTLRSYKRPSMGIALPVFAFSIGGLISSALILVIAAVLSLPLASAANLGNALPWIIVLALIIFVPPNFLVLWAAQRIDPGRVGILLMSEVLSGAITAALFSGESFGYTEMSGTAMIVCAGLIEVLGRR
jgi:drug/metabolite transporter (DMT)-like permease